MIAYHDKKVVEHKGKNYFLTSIMPSYVIMCEKGLK